MSDKPEQASQDELHQRRQSRDRRAAARELADAGAAAADAAPAPAKIAADPGFLSELKRRNVLRMAGLYLVAAWLITQVASTVLPAFGVGDWAVRAAIVLLAIGFVPALVVSWVFELTPDGLKREVDVAREASIAPQTAHRLERTTLVLLALALAYFAFDRFVVAPRREAAAVAAASDQAAAAALAQRDAEVRATSIAVLPFTNLSPDPEQAYFSDGLAEDLITALAQLGSLKVAGRNSSFQFRERTVDPVVVGEKLGVAMLLTGSVRRQGDVVRINLELLDVGDGRALWSRRFDRPYGELFALQDDITRAVASELHAALVHESPGGSQDERPPGGDLEAYNAFLRGKFHRARVTPEDDALAISAFEKAITLDPRYAMAQASLADALSWHAAQYLGEDEARGYYDRARAANAVALALAPDLSFPHLVQGELLGSADFDFAGARAEFARALELAPNDVRTLAATAALMQTLGETAQAVELAARAVEIDPLLASAHSVHGATLTASGRLDEAEAAIRRANELSLHDVGLEQLVLVQILRGDGSAALATAAKLTPGPWRDIAVASAKQRIGDPAAADAALAQLIADHGEVAAFQIAEVQALRNDADAAFEWLDRAWETRDPGLYALLASPLLQPLHADPRFAALCAKVGLPAPR